MSPENALPPVADDEKLARFILFRNWIRNDSTVRPDAFIPYPHPNLSVYRHIGLAEPEVWQIGRAIANARPAKLYGRADILASDVKHHSLRIEPTPTPKNHANITGWPERKPEQKIIALKIAASAHFVPQPAIENA